MKKIKEQSNFNRTIIDLEFKPYIAIFRNEDCFEIVIKGFSNRNIEEAVEQANLALYDYIFKIHDELGFSDSAEIEFNTYELVEIRVA